ncbi:MAG: two-component system activity regulator YycH [Aminipila sp.]
MEKLPVDRIEKFKNILLVVLVFTTILLLYFLWGSKSLEAFIFNDNDEAYKVMSSKEVILPDQIILGRGNEDYTVALDQKEELWNNDILNTFRDFSRGTNSAVVEITEQQYKDIMKYPSIIAKFEYNIPFDEFCEKYGIKKLQGYDGISNLTEIGFSKGSKGSTFIYDGDKKKYYGIVGNKKLGIFDKIDTIFEQQEVATYYPLKTVLGEESTNDTLVPFELPPAIIPIDYKKDVEIGQKENTSDIAQKYFGETFDFVRKVEESKGTTIYMYGYGQKVLIINPNEGSIEYKEEVKTENPEQASMFDSLDTALTFVASHGEFKTIAGQEIKPCLESASTIDDKKNSYRFVLSFMIGKNKLFYEDKMPIIIEVVDGQVSYFRREFINFDENQVDKRSNKEGISAINMLTMNYEYMREALTKAGFIDKEESKNISFENLANKIDNMYTGYLKATVEPSVDETVDTQKNLELVPVWVVEVNDTLLYFDLYDGQPKGSSKNY